MTLSAVMEWNTLACVKLLVILQLTANVDSAVVCGSGLWIRVENFLVVGSVVVVVVFIRVDDNVYQLAFIFTMYIYILYLLFYYCGCRLLFMLSIVVDSTNILLY